MGSAVDPGRGFAVRGAVHRDDEEGSTEVVESR